MQHLRLLVAIDLDDLRSEEEGRRGGLMERRGGEERDLREHESTLLLLLMGRSLLSMVSQYLQQ